VKVANGFFPFPRWGATNRNWNFLSPKERTWLGFRFDWLTCPSSIIDLGTWCYKQFTLSNPKAVSSASALNPGRYLLAKKAVFFVRSAQVPNNA
jgi:hypothetical protein